MQIGSRVVTLASERHGTIVGVGREGALLVVMDDLNGGEWESLNPLPFDAFELELVTTPQFEATAFADAMAERFREDSA
jgi:hypothetical protein